MTDKSELLAGEPETIFLQPNCCAYHGYDGRQWCEDAVWEECECPEPKPIIRYIRADIAEAALAAQPRDDVPSCTNDIAEAVFFHTRHACALRIERARQLTRQSSLFKEFPQLQSDFDGLYDGLSVMVCEVLLDPQWALDAVKSARDFHNAFRIDAALATTTQGADSGLADKMTRSEVKALWVEHGGSQHGPMVEHYTIEEQAFYRFATAFQERTRALAEGAGK